MIRIKSKKEGFRRCGIAHPKTPTEYPDGRFSKEVLAVLKAEPMLVVEIIRDAPGGDDIVAMNVAQLIEEIAAFQPGAPLKGLKKAELVEILKAHREAAGA